jgi:hypothetical protein
MSALIGLFKRSIRDGSVKQGLLWTLLLAVCFALTGVVAVPSVPKPLTQHAERFPCENCPCGCSTAAYCWDKCCCNSDQEKLDWAERHHVEPPDFLVARVKAQRFTDLEEPKPSCCCCGTQPESTCPPKEPDVTNQGDAEATAPTGLVLMWKAAECRGIHYLYSMLNAVNVLPDHDDYLIELPQVGWASLTDECAQALPVSPEPPIP